MEDVSHWKIAFEDLKFEKQLGRGSFGEVWKGEYQGTPVAIKQLYDVDNSEMEKYFVREIEALTKINHPHIVQLLGMCITQEHIFIVTEFVENGDLHSKVIDPGWVFNWKRRVGILKDIARAMIYLHGRERMHRDLKSANLLLTNDWKAKVCDFGLARSRAKSEEEMGNMTVAGTLEWMAPEISLGEAYDLPIDVFSYGMVMYEIIFRLPPPRRLILMSYAFQPNLYTPPEDTPAGLWQLLVDCAEQDPSRRPTFVQILSRLDEIDKTISGKPEQHFDKELRKEALKNQQNKKPQGRAATPAQPKEPERDREKEERERKEKEERERREREERERREREERERKEREERERREREEQERREKEERERREREERERKDREKQAPQRGNKAPPYNNNNAPMKMKENSSCIIV